jgi:hypothetical protein
MRRGLLPLVCVLLLRANAAPAAVLFSSTISDVSIGSNLSNVTLSVIIRREGHPIMEKLCPLFEDATWGIDDLGTTRVVTAATDPDFDGFAAFITNGIKDDIGFYALTPAGGVGHGFAEPSLFFGDAADPRIDLQGNVIESISIYLESTTSYIFTINGVAIPEPSSGMLIILGVVLLSARADKLGIMAKRKNHLG